jgi:hypothetical protein
MGHKEALMLRFVLWLVDAFLREKVRVFTPEGLNKVIDDYLAELPKLGLKIVSARSKIGVDDDKIMHQSDSEPSSDRSPRVPVPDL